MDTIKKQLPLFATVVVAIVVGSLLNEQIAKMRVNSLKAA